MTPVSALLVAVLLTIVSEGLVWWLLARSERDWRRLAAGVVVVNLLTVPLANLAFGLLTDRDVNEWVAFVAIECLVIAAEVPLIRAVLGVATTRAATLSVAANIVSLTLGLLLFW